MDFKIPLYTPVHKGQRRWLSDISVRAGRTDYSKPEEVEWLIRELDAFTQHLKEHAGLEERFIHPTLNLIVPSCPRNIESEHKSQHQDLEDLEKSLNKIRGMPPDHELLQTVGFEFYLALNRFNSTYLKHIDFEEDHVQQILFNDCTADELMVIFKNVLAAQSPPALMANLKLMLSGMNVPETIRLLTTAKSILPGPVFQQMSGQVATFIEPERWALVQEQLARQ